MKTVTIQIGNSDDKLSQKEWSKFINQMNHSIDRYASQIHFFGGGQFTAPWQNVCWVLSIDEKETESLKREVEAIRKGYKQNSVAWTNGETELV